jgi:hypothetical protein
MKSFFMILAGVALLVSSVSAEYFTTAKVLKQSDGTYQVIFPINDWQSNPEAATKDLANKTVTFGKDVTVCAVLYSNGKQVKQGNHMLVTVTNWSKYEAVATLAFPEGANITDVLIYCKAPEGESKATNGSMLLNPKDPSYTPAGYKLKLNG